VVLSTKISRFVKRGNMNETKDRRTFDRLIVPEIKAFMINDTWYYLMRCKLFYSIAIFILGRNQIQNLSASGSCILSSNNFEPGKEIYLFLSSPGRKTIFIKGIVRWVSSDRENVMNYVGTQFLAYGNGKRYNSLKVLEQLHIYTLQNTVLAER
jgi:hypothetical protein